MRHTFAGHAAWLLLALITLICLAGASAISLAVPVPSADGFNVARWEMRHVPNKWLYLTGRMLRGRLSTSEEDEVLGRYLVLSARLRRQEASLSADDVDGRAAFDRLLRERDALENDTEAIIEGRLTAVLKAEGLQSSLPLFPEAGWVFPPVDVEFDEPPRVLNLSPRERIELVDQRPLRPGLSLTKVIEIEETAEEETGLSALASRLAGVAAYPSIVTPRADLPRLVETVAHEWVHHYLSFRPLGLRYQSNLKLQTLNETVADLAGRELAELFVERYPPSQSITAELATLSPAVPAIDAGPILRQLRLDVEELLDGGRVEDAEALMEQRRLELAGQGVFYRKINQAFFAFRNIYAGDPASIDPLGKKVATLRERTRSVGAFLRAASALTGSADLDRLLEELSQPED